MAEIPHPIEERLSRVAERVTWGESIQQARNDGASAIVDAPLLLVQQTVSLSRQNPVLGTALGCGALGAVSVEGDPQRLALARLSLGIGLAWWGYHAESLPFLRDAEATLTDETSALIGAYARWHHLVSQRRFATIDGLFDTMMGIADGLDRWDDPTGAMQCRLDAVSGSEISEANPQPAVMLNRAERYFQDHDLTGDLGITQTIQTYWLLRQGHLDAAVEMVQHAEQHFQRENMPAMLAWAWFQHGLYHYHRREISSAYEYIDRGISEADALHHQYYRANMLILKAEVQNSEGNLHESLRTLQSIEPITVELELAFLRANNLLTAGHIHQHLGSYAAAQESYLRAKEIFFRFRYEAFATLCDANLGRVATGEGRFGDALTLLQEAIRVFEDNGENEFYALATLFLAQAYQSFGYRDAAVEKARDGIAVLDRANAPNHSLKLAIYLASLMIGEEEAHEAEEWLQRAERLSSEAGLRKDAALAQQIRGEVLRQRGDFAEAIRAFQQSKIELHALGQLEAAHDSEIGEAEAHISQGNAMLATRVLATMNTESLAGQIRWRHEIASARVAILQQEPDAALMMYLSAMRRMRISRRTLSTEALAEYFVTRLRPVFEDAFGLAADLNRPSDQLSLAEMYGAQLISVRFGQPIDAETALPIEERVRDQMMAQVGSGWTILRYAWQNDGLLWRFMITPDVFEAHPIPITEEVQEAFRFCTFPDESYRRITYGEAASMGQQSRRILHEALLPASLGEHCHPDQPLIIIPSRSLYRLPFHALLDRENRPLIEQAEVMYAASLDLLQASPAMASPQGLFGATGLICAQNEFSDPQLNDLQYSLREAELVHSIMGGRAEIRTEADFQRDALNALDQNGILGAMKWLHFITHSQYDRYSGAFMGLATQDDTIWVEDILRWTTHADLVTLSACQTGVGHARLGDEIEGMIQAFLSGGAQNVIASLWLVGDNDIGLSFMGQLYQRIVMGDSPVRALAQVQRQAIERNLPAHQWAPFFLTGRPTSHARSAPQDAPHPATAP